MSQRKPGPAAKRKKNIDGSARGGMNGREEAVFAADREKNSRFVSRTVPLIAERDGVRREGRPAGRAKNRARREDDTTERRERWRWPRGSTTDREGLAFENRVRLEPQPSRMSRARREKKEVDRRAWKTRAARKDRHGCSVEGVARRGSVTRERGGSTPNEPEEERGEKRESPPLPYRSTPGFTRRGCGVLCLHAPTLRLCRVQGHWQPTGRRN